MLVVVVGVCDSSCPDQQSARRLTLADNDETGALVQMPSHGPVVDSVVCYRRHGHSECGTQATSDRYRLPLPAVQYQ